MIEFHAITAGVSVLVAQVVGGELIIPPAPPEPYRSSQNQTSTALK